MYIFVFVFLVATFSTEGAGWDLNAGSSTFLDGYGDPASLEGGPSSVVLDSNSPYCDFDMPLGPLCNMTGVDEILIIPENLKLPRSLEIEVHNAIAVVLYPTCIPWVQVYNINGLTTPRGKGDCRTWLRAYNSRLNSLTNGINDLTLVLSSVEVINLYGIRDILTISSNVSVIQHLDWRGYSGSLYESRIGTIISMECNDDVTMLAVTIGNIFTEGFKFSANRMRVNNTVFNHVSEQGIQILDGEAEFYNTVFEDVKKYGISVKSGATLKMHNVTIARCASPCLVIPYHDAADLVNVTIAGKLLDAGDDYVVYSEYEKILSPNASLQRLDECSTYPKEIVCDFSGSRKQIFLNGTDDFSTSNITVHNAGNIHIINSCNLNLTLHNSEGSYKLGQPSGSSSQPNCASAGSLTIVNTTLWELITTDLDTLKIVDSKVDRMHIKAIEKSMELRNSTVVSIDALTVINNAIWENSTVYSIANTRIGQLQANKMRIRKVKTTTIGKPDTNSSITNSKNFGVGSWDFRIEGPLILQNVLFRGNMRLVMFNLSETGHITLQSVQGLPDHAYSISAVRHDQVTWLDDDSKYSKSVFIRGTKTPPQVANSTQAAAGQPHCKVDQRFRVGNLRPLISAFGILCNYTGLESGEHVTISKSQDSSTRSIQIVGAQNVSLSNICLKTIILENVQSAVMPEAEGICIYTLRGRNSSFQDIINDPLIIFLYKSRATGIYSRLSMFDLYMNETTVGELKITSTLAKFEYSSINKIKFLRSSRNSMTGMRIGTIDDMVVKNTCTITNSDIKRISSGAIDVYVKIVFENVTIGTLDTNSINLRYGAWLIMKNVTIYQGWKDSFNYSNSIIELTNVFLNGIKLENIEFLEMKSLTTTPVSTSESSSSHVSTASVSITTENTSASSSSTFVPPVMSTTSNSSGANSSTLKPSLVSAPPSTTKRWVGAAAGTFLLLCLVLGFVFAVVAVRARRSGQQVLPGSCFRGSDVDSDDSFLTTEMDVHSIVERDAYTTHYSRLPSL